SNFQMNQSGAYDILVYNGGGSALGTDFIVTGRIPLGITVQPQSRIVVVGSTTNFSLTATGMNPIFYRWYLNGSPVPNGTNSTLTVANIQPAVEGKYFCIVTDP